MSGRGPGWWTRYFAVASALGMVGLQVAELAEVSTTARALVALLLVVLPMIFGMGYLLFPSFVGQTLATPRAPAAVFVLTYTGGLLLVIDVILGLADALRTAGATLWTMAVIVFLGTLAYSVGPALYREPSRLFRPQRSTRLATAVLPLGLAYLLIRRFQHDT